MQKRGMPLTRESYLMRAYPEGVPKPWTAELEEGLPEELQDYRQFDLPEAEETEEDGIRAEALRRLRVLRMSEAQLDPMSGSSLLQNRSQRKAASRSAGKPDTQK
jgi:hypothetical protein